MNEKNCRVFMDISINKKPIGRMEFDLFQQEVPRAVENFRALCTGEKGKSNKSGKFLHYKNSIFHRIIPGFMCQGGDFTNFNGTGGESIYGGSFDDENFKLKHTPFGTLSMANSGRNSNGSQFFITTGECSHLDGKHVVFGRITKGEEILRAIESQGTPNGKPLNKVEVIACGQFLK